MKAPRTRSFGLQESGRSYRVRPAAYVVVLDEKRRVACVAEEAGLFLPGGGIEAGENPVRAAHREVAEECARELEIVSSLDPAIQFFSTARGESYELHAEFFLGRFGAELRASVDQVRWFPVTPEPLFFHECHRWALRQALGKA
jgi:8-oxo-dGTP diphosphatase